MSEVIQHYADINDPDDSDHEEPDFQWVVLATDYAALEAECEQLRVELETIKGQEPVGVVAIRKTEHGSVVEGVLYGTFVIDAEPGTKLYAKPTA